MRHQEKSRLFLFAVTGALALGACAEIDDHDSSVGGGKADALGYEEGSIEALAVLRFVNRASAEELHDQVGVRARPARNLVEHRVGPDDLAGTADDNPFDTLDEVAYVVAEEEIGKILYYVWQDDLLFDPANWLGLSCDESERSCTVPQGWEPGEHLAQAFDIARAGIDAKEAIGQRLFFESVAGYASQQVAPSQLTTDAFQWDFSFYSPFEAPTPGEIPGMKGAILSWAFEVDVYMDGPLNEVDQMTRADLEAVRLIPLRDVFATFASRPDAFVADYVSLYRSPETDRMTVRFVNVASGANVALDAAQMSTTAP